MGEFIGGMFGLAIIGFGLALGWHVFTWIF